MTEQRDELRLMAECDGEAAPSAAAPSGPLPQAWKRLDAAAREALASPGVPDDLQARVESLLRKPPAPPLPLWKAAAAVLFVAASLATVLYVYQREYGGQDLGYDITQDPVFRLIDAGRTQHWQDGAAVSAGGLGQKVREVLGIEVAIPDPAGIGYALQGAEVASLEGGKAVHIVFRQAQDPSRRLSLFLQARELPMGSCGLPSFSLVSPHDDAPAAIWRSGPLGYLLVAQDRETLDAAMALFNAPPMPR